MANTKAKDAGQTMAEAIIRFLHLMYQKDTAMRVLRVLIAQLEKGKDEFERGG